MSVQIHLKNKPVDSINKKCLTLLYKRSEALFKKKFEALPKRTVQQDILPPFSQMYCTPPKPFTWCLKTFQIWLRIQGDICDPSIV